MLIKFFTDEIDQVIATISIFVQRSNPDVGAFSGERRSNLIKSHSPALNHPIWLFIRHEIGWEMASKKANLYALFDASLISSLQEMCVEEGRKPSLWLWFHTKKVGRKDEISGGNTVHSTQGSIMCLSIYNKRNVSIYSVNILTKPKAFF